MSQKKETIPLLLALLMIGAIIGGISWWLIERVFPPETERSDRTQTGPESTTQTIPQTFAKVQNVPSGLFNYGGSTTWAPIRKTVDAAIETVWPDFRLRYTNPISGVPSSRSGIKMLLEDQLSFSHSSRPLKIEEYQEAEQRGFTLKEIPVAIDGIAIAVHPDLNIPGLTIAQLKDIYTGKITNWNQLGGPNIAIVPLSRRLEEGAEFFVENILENQEFGANVQFIPTTTEALRQVAQNFGSIYYASAPEVVPQCMVKSLPIGHQADEFVTPYQQPFIPLSQCPTRRNQVNESAFESGEYPITRRLFVIIKQNGQEDEKAGIAYVNLLLTNQGQKLIAEAGFVSIR